MGYQFKPRKVRIQFEASFDVDGLEIWASRDTTIDQVEELQALQGESEGTNDRNKIRAFLGFAADHVLVAWNVEDAKSKPLPITAKTLGTIPLDVLNEAIRQYVVFMKGGEADANLGNGSAPIGTVTEPSPRS